MTCGQIAVGGCANPDLAHHGKCTPWSGRCKTCGPVVGECEHSGDHRSRIKMTLGQTRRLIREQEET